MLKTVNEGRCQLTNKGRCRHSYMNQPASTANATVVISQSRLKTIISLCGRNQALDHSVCLSISQCFKLKLKVGEFRESQSQTRPESRRLV